MPSWLSPVPQCLERYPALTMHLQSFCRVIAGRAIAIAGVILLAGCATPYQPKSFTGGFSETQLSENTFRVYFRGNGYTGEERAEDFTLLRSAQLAEEHGFSYFIIVDENSASSLAAASTPTQSYTTASATSVGGTTYGTAQTTTVPGHTFLIRKPSKRNTIVCFREKPDIPAVVYESAFVVQSIRSKYGMMK
jgi:hypothetical protein